MRWRWLLYTCVKWTSETSALVRLERKGKLVLNYYTIQNQTKKEWFPWASDVKSHLLNIKEKEAQDATGLLRLGSLSCTKSEKSLFKKVFIFGCTGSLLPWGLFSRCRQWGLLSGCGAWASHCGGCSVVEQGLSCAQACKSAAPGLERRRSSCGARAQMPCSM